MVHMGALITVSGAVGGIGTSTFAYGLALQFATGAVLIDAQPDGVSLDCLIGAEECAGIRWSQVRVRSADISAEAIRAALPQHHGVHVLASDAEATADAVAIPHLVTALLQADSPVVLDISARDGLREMLHPDLDVMLLPATLPGIVSAQASLRSDTRLVLVEDGRAEVLPAMVSESLEREIVGVVRWQRAVLSAATAGVRPPATTDVMRVAALLVAGLVDVV
jgi:hypothetical protein